MRWQKLRPFRVPPFVFIFIGLQHSDNIVNMGVPFWPFNINYFKSLSRRDFQPCLFELELPVLFRHCVLKHHHRPSQSMLSSSGCPPCARCLRRVSELQAMLPACVMALTAIDSKLDLRTLGDIPKCD
ncbi:hypothetical protein FB451DRAFT_1212916 [Mycena latifolia]|nr:hypothetical protein FB451DRAFT_1212916 [Mycena latifolia]